MSYRELPSIEKSLSRYVGLTIEGMNTIKGCCLNDVAVIRPQSLGQRLQCSRCSNIMTTKETNTPLFENANEATLPGRLKKLAKGFAVHLIQYTKPFWVRGPIDNDLRLKGIVNNFISDTVSHTTIVQTPADWFEKGTIQIFSPQPGITVVAGRIKEQYADKLATIKELGKGINKGFIGA